MPRPMPPRHDADTSVESLVPADAPLVFDQFLRIPVAVRRRRPLDASRKPANPPPPAIQALWELFQRVVPEAPSRPQAGGRRRHGNREVLAAIVFVATSGCTPIGRVWLAV